MCFALDCIGKKQNGEDLRIELGEQKSDGLNYIYSCEAVYEAAAKKKSKRKPTPISAKYRRISMYQ